MLFAFRDIVANQNLRKFLLDRKLTFFVWGLAIEGKSMVEYWRLKARKAYSMIEDAEPSGLGCSIAMGRKPERTET